MKSALNSLIYKYFNFGYGFTVSDPFPLRTMVIETFKIAYGQSPQYLQYFIIFKDSASYNIISGTPRELNSGILYRKMPGK